MAKWSSIPQGAEKSTDSSSNKEKKSASQIEQMMEMFLPEEAQRRIEDLIISAVTRKQLDTALNRIRFHKELYEEWDLKSVDPYGHKVAINFYGPPGTGKTFCAEAVAQHVKKTILKVSYAEIESKYVGDTSKAIKAAFMKAHQTESVLFFDEADSILGKRLTNVTQSADHAVNVSRSTMLLELDKFDGIVLFATNLPKNFDSAFVRRIMAHIEFDLPDKECRTKLWQYLLPKKVQRENEVTVNWLAEQSEGLAGGDILNIVKISASQAIARKGNERKVTQTDIQEALAQVRTSKQKVGHNDGENRIIEQKEERISPEQLPPDAKEEFDKVVANSPEG